MYIALDLSDDDRARASEKIIVIDRNDVHPAQMKEIWHGSIEQACRLRDALDAVLPAAALPDAPSTAARTAKKKTPKPKKRVEDFNGARGR